MCPFCEVKLVFWDVVDEGEDEMPIYICPQCKKRFVRLYPSGEYSRYIGRKLRCSK